MYAVAIYLKMLYTVHHCNHCNNVKAVACHYVVILATCTFLYYIFQVQTRSADEPMTTFCFCNECGHRWKFCWDIYFIIYLYVYVCTYVYFILYRYFLFRDGVRFMCQIAYLYIGWLVFVTSPYRSLFRVLPSPRKACVSAIVDNVCYLEQIYIRSFAFVICISMRYTIGKINKIK